MKNALQAALIVFVLTLTVCTVRIERDAESVLLSANAFVVNANNVASAVGATTAETQHRVVDTSQNINALLVQMGLAADNIRRASDRQSVVTNKTLAILDHTDALIAQVSGNVDALTTHSTAVLDAVPPVLDQLNLAAQHTGATLDAATGSFNQASLLMQSTDPFVANLGKITADGYTVEHQYFFPDKKKIGVAGYLWRGFQFGTNVALPGAELRYYLSNK